MATRRIGSFCTGYGGLDIAVQRVFGGDLAWASDIDPGASRIIAHRYPGVPNLGDLTTTDWQQVRDTFGRPDVVCGGYPCQPFSTAGLRKGIEDERHIWPYIAHTLGVLRPRYAIFENVAGHLGLGFDAVLADFARLGFDVEWDCVRADEVGAPHRRRRLIIVARAAADAADLGHERSRDARGRGDGSANDRQSVSHAERLVPGDNGELPARRHALRERVWDDAPRCGAASAADAYGERRGPGEHGVRTGQPDAAWGRFLPAIRRWEHVLGRPAPRATDDQSRLSPPFVEWLMGLPAGHVTDVPGLSRNAQLHALGNGVVPQQAEAAIRLLLQRFAAEPLAVAA